MDFEKMVFSGFSSKNVISPNFWETTCPFHEILGFRKIYRSKLISHKNMLEIIFRPCAAYKAEGHVFKKLIFEKVVFSGFSSKNEISPNFWETACPFHEILEFDKIYKSKLISHKNMLEIIFSCGAYKAEGQVF